MLLAALLGLAQAQAIMKGIMIRFQIPVVMLNTADLFPGQTLSEVLDTAVIHHEGDFQDYNVQAIQREHMYGNGWMDIGYHYVVAPDGTIYAGRSNTARGVAC